MGEIASLYLQAHLATEVNMEPSQRKLNAKTPQLSNEKTDSQGHRYGLCQEFSTIFLSISKYSANSMLDPTDLDLRTFMSRNCQAVAKVLDAVVMFDCYFMAG